MDFYILVTEAGKNKIAQAVINDTKLDLTQMAVGDGNGSYYEPDEFQTSLLNETWRGNINEVSISTENENDILVETIIPPTSGGYTIREVGIFDSVGELIAIGKYPQTDKPVPSDGSLVELIIRAFVQVNNTEVINLEIDPNIQIVTEDKLKEFEEELYEKTYTTEPLDYYIDPVIGDDNNNGSQTSPFKTIGKAVSLLPQFVNHPVNIILAEGTYNEQPILSTKLGVGRITIKGATSLINASKYKVIGFRVLRCTCLIRVEGVELTAVAAHSVYVNGSTVDLQYIRTVISKPLAGVLAQYDSYVTISDSEISNIVDARWAALHSYTGGIITSNNVTGNGNTIGVYAQSGIIYIEGIQPLGNTLEKRTQGGQIFATPKRLLDLTIQDLFFNTI